MLRLSQQALSDVSLSFTHAGLSDVRDLNSLQEVLLLVRGRVRDSTAGNDAESQRLGLIRAIQPLTMWMQQQADIADLPILVKCELAWNLYTAALSRTNGADAFGLITASEEAWNDALARAFGQGGRAVAVSDSLRRNEQRSAFGERFPWLLLLVSLASFGAEQFVESGRWRLYLLLTGAGALACALTGLYWRYTTAPVRFTFAETGRTHQQTFETGGREMFETTTGPTVLPVSSTTTPPPLAPTLPGNEQVLPTPQSSSAVQGFSVGEEVSFTGDGEARAVLGQSGIVIEVDGALVFPEVVFFSFCSKKQLLEARSCFLEVSFLAASCFFQLPAAFFNFQEAASWPRSSF